MRAWLAHSLRRFYPASPAEENPYLVLEAARGERLSFQAACRTGLVDRFHQSVEVEAQGPEGLTVTVRQVGFVPLPHLNTDIPPQDRDPGLAGPGYVPDPLWPTKRVRVGPLETHAFWITVAVSRDIVPGVHPVRLAIRHGDETARLEASLVVHRAQLPRRTDFPVTHWFYVDRFCARYGVEPFEPGFWTRLTPFLADMSAHGQDTIHVPLWTPPLSTTDAPAQLLHVTVAEGRLSLDWELARRWVRSAREQGLTRFEWPHLFRQWGAFRGADFVVGHGRGQGPLWPGGVDATSVTYRGFLAQLLPAFERFLREEHLLERSVFHLSDEPDGNLTSYRAARRLVADLAPWMEITEALADSRFRDEGLIDTPVVRIDQTDAFAAADRHPWAYYCCWPRGRHLNRLLDTPLPKIRMSGWLFYALGARGFLHWGYNYWLPAADPSLPPADGGRWPEWPYGDAFVVYPGPDGPVDSLRWEVFAESLQDYALLQAAGWTPAGGELQAIQDYARFPRDPEWIASRRARLLRESDG